MPFHDLDTGETPLADRPSRARRAAALPKLRLPDGSVVEVGEHALVRLEQRFAATAVGGEEVLDRVQLLLNEVGQMSSAQPGWVRGEQRRGYRYASVGEDFLLILRGPAVVTGIARGALSDYARQRRNEAAAARRSWRSRPRRREGRHPRCHDDWW